MDFVSYFWDYYLPSIYSMEMKMNKKIYLKPLAIPLAAVFLSVFGGLWYGALFHDV